MTLPQADQIAAQVVPKPRDTRGLSARGIAAGLGRRLQRVHRRVEALFSRPRRQDIHLTLQNRGGSVQHYHHFLFGFLVPLVHIWDRLPHSDGFVHVRSCAVLDPLLVELGQDRLRILDAAEHAALRDQTYVSAAGYDLPPHYDADVFAGVRATLFRWLAARIERERSTVAALFPPQGPRVLIIDRLPPDAFYLSDASEKPGSGTLRRSVPNMAALTAAARAEFGAVALATLEGKSLAFQMALFDAADVIIAQHGAGLSNLIWARPGTRVVEILPEENRAKGRDFFGGLCRHLGMRYECLPQQSSHSPVDPAGLVALFDGWNERAC